MSIISCTEKPTKNTDEDFKTTLAFQYQVVDSGSVKNPWTKIIADIDDDGALDIIIGGQKGPLVWYKNPEWERFDIADGGYDTVDGEAGDIDGDGDLDIVMGGLFWYENPGNLMVTQEKSWKIHQIADHPTHDVELADINNDGLIDVITRNQSEFGTMKGNTIHVWTNNGNDAWDEEIIECEHGEGLKVTDLEGDGDEDIIGSGFWFENLGVDGWEKHDITAWHASANLEVGDLNSDNRLDIVLTPSELAGQYYKMSWFEQPQDIAGDNWMEHVLVDSIECVIHGVGVGDFNADKVMDIAYSEMHQGQDPDEVVIMINNGNGASWEKIVLSEKGSHSIEVGDINGDGIPDILGANWSGDYQPVEIWFSGKKHPQNYRSISKAELTDKIYGYWIGQLAGNYVGFPFENLYADEPIPVFIDRYTNYKDADSLGLKMNLNDRRGFVNIMADAMGGAWTDDDTDIEFVTLHAIEKYGLDLNYEEIAAMRQEHVKRFIWSSNARVKALIDEGYLPPRTGSKELNDYWYRISSQLINEIWGAVYPGMTDKAAERAEWGARITNDSWGTHGTRVIVTMYSAAFFEKDPYKLLEIGMSKLPDDSPYLAAFKDLLKWSKENDDWKVTRQLIHDKYFKEVDGFTIPYPVGGAVINGLNGVMALLYGKGDFTQTVGIATTTGYDCDNQAATMGGLIGVINGGSTIPDKFTKKLPSRGSWDKPFNDTYINYSRDNLPNFNKISDIVDRLVAIAELAILENGGSKSEENGQIIYHIRTDF